MGGNPGAGLTPTKQSVINLLFSKIELNDDQLNELIEEPNKTEGGSGVENPQSSKRMVVENPQNLIGQGGGISDLIRNEGAVATAGVTESEGGDILSLEQLASGNIASITRIDSSSGIVKSQAHTDASSSSSAAGVEHPTSITTITQGARRVSVTNLIAVTLSDNIMAAAAAVPGDPAAEVTDGGSDIGPQPPCVQTRVPSADLGGEYRNMLNLL